MPPRSGTNRTPKQLANDRRMKEAAQARRESGDTATAVLERPSEAADEEYLSTEDLFGQAAALFQKAGTEGRLTRTETNTLEGILGKIDPLKNPEIAENPAVQRFLEQMNERMQQSPDIPPGTIMGTGLAARKKIWTERDVRLRMWAWSDHPELQKIVKDAGLSNPDPAFKPTTFTPRETIPLIWNGLGIMVEQDMEATVPFCFYEIYLEHYRGMRSGDAHKNMLFGKTNQLDPRSVDVTIISPATGHVRGFYDGASLRDGVGPELAAGGEEEA